MADAYIASFCIDAPSAEPVPAENWLPSDSGTRLNPVAEGITSVIWATGFSLDFGLIDIPVLDARNYPRHSRGVTEVPGLDAVGLLWLTKHLSATLSAVGDDAVGSDRNFGVHRCKHVYRQRPATRPEALEMCMGNCCRNSQRLVWFHNNTAYRTTEE